MKGLTGVFAAGCFFAALTVHADVVQHIGNYGEWGSVQWEAIGGLDDADDGVAAGQVDFVGDSTHPTGFWAMDEGYVYFRMQLGIGAATAATFKDSHFVLIDAVGYSADDGRPDYGFVWDSASNKPEDHGLEMSVLSATLVYCII